MHRATTHPTMRVSRRRRLRIIEMSELMPGIWLSTPPIRESILASSVRC